MLIKRNLLLSLTQTNTGRYGVDRDEKGFEEVQSSSQGSEKVRDGLNSNCLDLFVLTLDGGVTGQVEAIQLEEPMWGSLDP